MPPSFVSLVGVYGYYQYKVVAIGRLVALPNFRASIKSETKDSKERRQLHGVEDDEAEERDVAWRIS